MPKKAESWFWSLISHESLILEVWYPWMRQPVDSFGWFCDTRNPVKMLSADTMNDGMCGHQEQLRVCTMNDGGET